MEVAFFAPLLHGFVRAMAALLLLPLDVAGISLRATLALALTLYAWPQAGAVSPSYLEDVALGVLVGLPITLPSQLASMWGELFDLGRGQTVASVYDPFFNVGDSTSSTMMRWLAWTMVVLLGGLENMARMYAASFQEVGSGRSILSLLVPALHSCFLTALPILAVFLVLDISIGFLCRCVPGLFMQLEGTSAKTLVGFLIVTLWVQGFGVPWVMP